MTIEDLEEFKRQFEKLIKSNKHEVDFLYDSYDLDIHTMFEAIENVIEKEHAKLPNSEDRARKQELRIPRS